MRKAALFAFAACALLAAGALGSGAFANAALSPRTVQVAIVGDDAAYLSLAVNAASPHKCFVTTAAGGKASIRFDQTDAGCGGNGGGKGLNPGDGSNSAKYARYAFHDLLLVTNKGTKTILVWANATTGSSSGTISVAKEAASGAMVDADYAATSATSLSLAPGALFYLGVRADSGTTTAGGSVTGTVVIAARR